MNVMGIRARHQIRELAIYGIVRSQLRVPSSICRKIAFSSSMSQNYVRLSTAYG